MFEINNIFFNHENFNKDEYKATLNINNEYTYMNNEIINNLFNLFKNYLKKDLLNKYQLDLIIKNNDINLNKGICFINNNEKDIQFKEKLYTIFPPLFIGVQNKYYKWNSEYYLYKTKNNNDMNEYCIGILPYEKENKDIIQFGQNFMFGHELIFNFTKKEIIVYESNCSMKPKNKINIKLESKYDKMNGYLKLVIIFMIIFALFLIFVIFRLRKRRSTLCIKFLGKEVTNEEINLFFSTNYNVIK